MQIVEWAKDNPAMAVGVGIVGIVALVWIFGPKGSAADAGASSAVAAYYGAVAQQGAAGAAVQMEQIRANAATNQTLIAATNALETNKVWAGNSLAIAQDASRVAEAEANLKHWTDMRALEVEHARVNLTSSDWVNATSTFTSAYNQALAAGRPDIAAALGGTFFGTTQQPSYH